MGNGDTLHAAWHGSGPCRVWLGLLVFAWGVQAIVTQSLLLREALVLMLGSEFAWGVVLFAWLFGVAVGAVIGGGVVRRMRRADVGLVIVMLALSAAACVELWVFRGARGWLGVAPGELLPLPTTALAAIVLVSPTSALVGMAFPLACAISCGRARDARRPDSAVGGFTLANIYALESAGSLVGGAAFSFWAVEHLAPIQTALGCGAITIAASVGLLGAGSRRPYGAVLLGGVAAAMLLAAVFGGDWLNRRLVDRRWENIAPGYELCAEVETKYQNLSLGRRAGQYTLYTDGHVSADFPDPYTFVPLANFWMCQHPQPRRVLVLGGGAEGLLAELLKHPLEHIDYVEMDAAQIALIEPFLAEVDRNALTDERVTVHHTDARYFVKTQRARFDLVIGRLPQPISALTARFYTDEFFGELRRAMTPRAVMCMTAWATPGSLPPIAAEYLGSIRATLRRHFEEVVVGWGNPAHLLAATAAGLIATDSAELTQRYLQRDVAAGWFDPTWFEGATDWLDPDKLRHRRAELDALEDVELSTDLRPVVYMQRLALLELATGETGTERAGVMQWLRSVRLVELVALLLLIAGITLGFCFVRTRSARALAGLSGGGHQVAPVEPTVAIPQWLARGSIIVSIGSTGFVTMALSIVWLFAFQNLYGYVYQRIGWIIAIFMGGLVLGCLLVGRQSRGPSDTGSLVRFLWRGLIVTDLLMALMALAVPFLLEALGSLQGGPASLVLVESCVSFMVLLTGVLGGAAFALAAGLLDAQYSDVQREAENDPEGPHGAALHPSVGEESGTLTLQARSVRWATATAVGIVGADHAGACLGALLSGILLVPVFGTATASLLLAGVKLSSAGLLLVARWRSGEV